MKEYFRKKGKDINISKIERNEDGSIENEQGHKAN